MHVLREILYPELLVIYITNISKLFEMCSWNGSKICNVFYIIIHIVRTVSHARSSVKRILPSVWWFPGSDPGVTLVGVVLFISELKSMLGRPYLIMHRLRTTSDPGFDTELSGGVVISCVPGMLNLGFS